MGPNMTHHVNSRRELLDRLSNPSEFLIRSWLTTALILGVIVILLAALSVLL